MDNDPITEVAHLSAASYLRTASRGKVEIRDLSDTEAQALKEGLDRAMTEAMAGTVLRPMGRGT